MEMMLKVKFVETLKAVLDTSNGWVGEVETAWWGVRVQEIQLVAPSPRTLYQTVHDMVHGR